MASNEKNEAREQYFYCPRCGSLRVVGMKMQVLNWLPAGPKGELRPTVKEDEIKRIIPIVAAPKHFVGYCFNQVDGADCGLIDRVYTPEMVAEHHPEQAS